MAHEIGGVENLGVLVDNGIGWRGPNGVGANPMTA